MAVTNFMPNYDMPTPEEVRFVRQVRRETLRYMQNPLLVARADYLERDAKRYVIENRYPEFFVQLGM